MLDSCVDVEDALRSAIAEQVDSSKFGLWFGAGVRFGLIGDDLTVGVPNRFILDRLQRHYTDTLQDAGEAVVGRRLRLNFEVRDDLEPEFVEVAPRPTPLERPEERRRPGSKESKSPVETPPPKPESRLNRSSRARQRTPKRLDQFVSGPNLQMAHAASVEMARSLGQAFNPLVIHGKIGCGKTHLIEGIAERGLAQHAGLRVVQQTAESFTNNFLEAMRRGGLAGFRARYRNADLLLIDDVHFLASKRATMDEFQHTFDALMASGAAIVLASDRHPRLIPRLSDELVTRFLAGMVVKVEVPDPKTRRAILKAKALERGVDLPEGIASFIADHLRASVRELEGALQSVLAYASLTGRRLDVNLARSALRDLIRHTASGVLLKDIERAICQLFELDSEVLKSESRSRAVTQPRMLAMYLARKHTGAAYSTIGRYFGGRNHSTVISAEKKVRAWIEDERQQSLLAGFESIEAILAAAEQSFQNAVV